MKVIIFGATGTVGQQIVQQALDAGYEVTAFCRDPSKLEHLTHPNLSFHIGDVLDAEAGMLAVEGHDAVCVALGSGKNRKTTVRSEGTRHIINAMQQTGVRRLICQTTLGAGDSHPNLNFFWRQIMFGWFLKQVFLDHELQEKYVIQSDLDWTIARPGAFTDGEHTGTYLHGFGPNEKTKLKISRKDVADFIVKELRTNQYLLKTASLSY